MTYHVGYSPSPDDEPREWSTSQCASPLTAARAFAKRLVANGELGYGEQAHVHVRNHGVWRFTIEMVIRIATTEKVR